MLNYNQLSQAFFIKCFNNNMFALSFSSSHLDNIIFLFFLSLYCVKEYKNLLNLLHFHFIKFVTFFDLSYQVCLIIHHFSFIFIYKFNLLFLFSHSHIFFSLSHKISLYLFCHKKSTLVIYSLHFFLHCFQCKFLNFNISKYT